MLASRKLSLAVAVAGTVAVIAGAAQAQEKPGFVSDGKFSVCTDASFPPMEYFEKSGDKLPVGFDVDLMNELGSAWGVSVEILPMDFSGLLPSLEAERCDAVISGIFVTDERKAKFDAVTYLDTVSVLAGKADAARVASLEELAGKVIAVQTGTSFVKQFEDINKDFSAKGLDPVKVQLYPKASDAIQQVLIGRAHAATTQDTELAFRDLQMPGSLASIYEFSDPQAFGVFVRRDGSGGAAVMSAVTGLRDNGALAGIAERWRLDPSKIAIR